MLSAFIILWIILAKTGWPLFGGMLCPARDHHRDALEQSENLRVKAARNRQYKRQLDQGTQSAQIIADAKRRRGEAGNPISPPGPGWELPV